MIIGVGALLLIGLVVLLVLLLSGGKDIPPVPPIPINDLNYEVKESSTAEQWRATATLKAKASKLPFNETEFNKLI